MPESTYYSLMDRYKQTIKTETECFTTDKWSQKTIQHRITKKSGFQGNFWSQTDDIALADKGTFYLYIQVYEQIILTVVYAKSIS